MFNISHPRRFFWLLVFALLLAWPGAVHAQDTGTHTVQAGETLSEIAKQYGTSTAMLMQLNGLANADVVMVGLPLRLPAVTTAVEEAALPAVAEEDSEEDAEQPLTLANVAVPQPNRFVEADGAFPYFTEAGRHVDLRLPNAFGSGRLYWLT